MIFDVQKTNFDINVDVEFDVNGGDSISYTKKTYTLGQTYSDLPNATKSGYICSGFYTDPTNGTLIKKTDQVDFRYPKLYAHYITMTNFTSFQVDITNSYKTFGFYSATKKSASDQIYIDWGDGNIESVDTISQTYHTYSIIGTYTVKVSDDITSLCVSNNSSTYYEKIRYTLKKILTYSTSITSIPQYCYYFAYYLNENQADMSHITSLGSHAFYYCYNITSISWLSQTSIISLPTYSFYYCYNLSSLNGCSKITSIGTYCFYYCKNLTSFTGLGNITSLPNYSFYQSGITSLDTLPTSVTSYGQYCLGYTSVSYLSKVRTTDTLNSYCFANMNSLTSLETLTPRSSLPSYCFYNCTYLKQANMSAWTNLTYLPMFCFYGTQNLQKFIAPSSLVGVDNYAFQNTYYGYLTADFSDSQITSIPYRCFYYSRYLKEVKLPNTVKYISEYAFYYCNNYLTSICLPSSLTGIYNYAFYYCSNLKNISCLAENAPTVQSYTFGSSTYNYTGRNSYSSGTNTLYVNNPNNYNTSYWSSVLMDSSKCGYHSESLDPYNLTYGKMTGLSSWYLSTGSEIIPEVSVYSSNGTLLTENTDYTKVLTNNVDVGTAQISAVGISPYKNFLSSSFKIVAEAPIITQLEYIQSTGTQYINTKIVPTVNTKAELKMALESTQTGSNNDWFVWLGSQSSDDSSNTWQLRTYSDQLTKFCPRVFNYNPITSGQTISNPYTFNTYILQNGSYSLNGTTYTGSASSSVATSLTLYLFGINKNRSVWSERMTCMKVEYLKLYESDTLILDLIPVKNPNGVVCMYDKISETYFYNQGIGNFIAGPERVCMYRYFKLKVNSIVNGTVAQVSRIEFVDQDNQYFNYPSETTWTATNVGSWPTNQDASKVLDHNTDTKMCPIGLTFPAEFIYDMKSECLDLNTYNRFQWYTADDTAAWPGRNLKNIQLYVSNDNTNWNLILETENCNAPVSNYTLAYTGNITL